MKLTLDEIWHISRSVSWIDTEGDDKEMDKISKKLVKKFKKLVVQNKSEYTIR